MTKRENELYRFSVKGCIIRPMLTALEGINHYEQWPLRPVVVRRRCGHSEYCGNATVKEVDWATNDLLTSKRSVLDSKLEKSFTAISIDFSTDKDVVDAL